jgi:hypothetical protein
MRTIKLAIPAAVLATGFLFCTSASYGTQQYAKKEKQSCTFCHAKSGGKAEMAKNLNATGTCYKDNQHSLANCAAPKK